MITIAVYLWAGLLALLGALLLEGPPETKPSRRWPLWFLCYLAVWPLFWMVLACVKYEVPSSFEAKDARSNRL